MFSYKKMRGGEEGTIFLWQNLFYYKRTWRSWYKCWIFVPKYLRVPFTSV